MIQKESTEIFINGKNTMTMPDIDQLKSHTDRAFHGIFVTTRRTKAAVATKGDEFQLSTMGADIHGTTKGRITTVDHFIDIFHLSIPGMKRICNFSIMV